MPRLETLQGSLVGRANPTKSILMLLMLMMNRKLFHWPKSKNQVALVSSSFLTYLDIIVPGFLAHPIPKDGDCMFACFSMHLLSRGIHKTNLDLRREVVAGLLQSPDTPAPLTSKEVANILTPKHWGGDIWPDLVIEMLGVLYYNYHRARR